MIAADHLGVGVGDTVVVTGDTATIPARCMGTFASRTAVNAGSSVHLAVDRPVAEQAKKIASEMLEVAVDAISMLPADGVEVRGVSQMRKSLREIASSAVGMYGFSMKQDRDPGLEFTSYFKPEQSTFANGTHVAEVEVDIDTGRVVVTRVVVNHDCGRVINPMVVEGQVAGGVAHGVGNAVLEQLLFLTTRRSSLTTSFCRIHDARWRPNMPRVEVHSSRDAFAAQSDRRQRCREKAGTIAVIAAIVSAIEDALSPFGVRLTDMPITPQSLVASSASALARGNRKEEWLPRWDILYFRGSTSSRSRIRW